MARAGTGIKPGRKPRFNPAMMKLFEEAIMVHAPIKTACAYANLHQSSFFDWMARGNDGEEPYREFSEQIRTFQENAKLHSLRNIKLQAAKDWRAETWLLAKRYRDEFGDGVQKVALTDPTGTEDHVGKLTQTIDADLQAQHMAQFIALAQAGALMLAQTSGNNGDNDSTE